MFPFPPSPPTPGSRPPSGVSPEERGKVVLLGAAFLFCLGLIAFLFVYSRGKSAPPEAPSPGPGPAPGAVEIETVPLFPEEDAEEIARVLLEDLSKMPPPAEGVAASDPEPFDYLVDQATLNARVLNLDPEGYDRDPPVERILEDPGAHRGRFVSAAGELLALDRVPYEGKVRQVQEVRRGLLRDAKGRLWTFSWPVANALEPDPVPPGAGWARVFGLLYKTWPAADPKEPARTVPTLHLVLSRRPQRDFPPVTVRDLDPAWLEQVRDATPAEMLRRDEEPLFHLLNLVKNLGPGGFEGWLRARQEADPGLRLWPPEDFSGRTKELLEHPDLHRFRPVSYTGFLVKPMELAKSEIPPNPGNVERVWFGVLVSHDFVPGVWIYSPRSLVDEGLGKRDHVRVEGLFYKRVAYEPAGGGPLSRAAVIVAARVVPVPIAPGGVAMEVLLVIAGVMVVLAGWLAFVILRYRREDRDTEARRRERLARRRKAAPTALPPPAGGPGA